MQIRMNMGSCFLVLNIGMIGGVNFVVSCDEFSPGLMLDVEPLFAGSCGDSTDVRSTGAWDFAVNRLESWLLQSLITSRQWQVGLDVFGGLMLLEHTEQLSFGDCVKSEATIEIVFSTKRNVEAHEELTWDNEIDFEDKEHPIKVDRLPFTLKLHVMWTFYLYMETVAIYCQLVLLQRTRNIDNLTGEYAFLLGTRRGSSEQLFFQLVGADNHKDSTVDGFKA
ncbi:ER lumen protein-retaining receptor [Tanacetum coccineum]